MIAKDELMRKIAGLPKQTASYKQLLRELGLRGVERQLLETMLADLVCDGKLIFLERDRYAMPSAAAQRNLVVGKLIMHRDGFGFVEADDAATRERLGGGVFIPPSAAANAMHGDQVMIELRRSDRGERPEGRVVRVLARGQATLVGVFHQGRRNNYVTPIDGRVNMPVLIPFGCERPSGDLSAERVLGAEVQRREFTELEGLVVDVAITDWPTAVDNPRGRVLEILGAPDDFGVDVEIMIRKHHLPHRFSPEALAEAAAAPRRIAPSERARRRDFRSLPIVTIDGETAKDFDDAVHVERAGEGWRLQAHIADVAHFVAPGSAIDVDAQLRGVSAYFPDRSTPMLPVELSSDLCSLRPKVDRLTMSCLMEIDASGEIVGFEICQGVIRSAARMTYTEVAAILDGDATTRAKYASLVGEFELMSELARVLNAKRQRRGSIDFDLPEPVIEFDENGLMQGVARAERNCAHRLIEEFMLAANEAVASYVRQRGAEGLHRVHEPPEGRRIHDFETIAASFGYSLGVGALPVERFRIKGDARSPRGSQRSARQIERPREVDATPQMYQKLTAKIAGKPEERILSYLMLRSLRQARYSETNQGHFALAAGDYAHFTSPIRRYPDLTTHRILKYLLAHGAERMEDGVAVGVGRAVRQQYPPQQDPRELQASPYTREQLSAIARQSSENERRADAAERELVEWKKAQFMQSRLGESYKGLIVSIAKHGLFIELEELFIEGLAPIHLLPGDRYLYHEPTRQIIGQRTRRAFSIGDRLQVLVDRVDPVEKKIQFALDEPEPEPRHKAGKGAKQIKREKAARKKQKAAKQGFWPKAKKGKKKRR